MAIMPEPCLVGAALGASAGILSGQRWASVGPASPLRRPALVLWVTPTRVCDDQAHSAHGRLIVSPSCEPSCPCEAKRRDDRIFSRPTTTKHTSPLPLCIHTLYAVFIRSTATVRDTIIEPFRCERAALYIPLASPPRAASYFNLTAMHPSAPNNSLP